MFRRRKKRNKGAVVDSLVLLRRRSAPLTVGDVERAAQAGLGIPTPPYPEDAQSFVVAEGGTPFMVKHGACLMMVLDMAGPYAERESARSIPEERLRAAVREHDAWRSVDVMAAPDGFTSRQRFVLVGRLLAELVDDGCLAVFVPETGALFAAGPRTRDALRSSDPITALQESRAVPIVHVDDDDRRMQAAVAEARTRFPEFVREFEAGNGESFSVKAPFREGDDTEFMWLNVTEITSRTIRGTLGNAPVDLRTVREGDHVEVAFDDLNDWCYVRDGEMVGGFTVSVLGEKLR